MFDKAVHLITHAHHITAFTGAGISVESGIPPFRGKDGLWNKIDPIFLDISYFHRHPLDSWKLIKQIFFDTFYQAEPNPAHFALKEMEKKGKLQAIITQNIDNLHHRAGNSNIFEYHGNSRNLVCLNCSSNYAVKDFDLEKLPPRCPYCNEPLKPDFIFFGEPIPEPARNGSILEAQNADVFILIGTTGEIMPASLIPFEAKRNNVKIIEVNVERTNFTKTITDIFLEGKASDILPKLVNLI